VLVGSFLLSWLSFAVTGFGALRDNIVNVCVVITVAMVMLLTDFGPCVHDSVYITLHVIVFTEEQFTSGIRNQFLSFQIITAVRLCDDF
jgi:oligoribonuclease (3'-5' exoribonuclease)